MADTIERIAIVGCGQVGTSILLALATGQKNIPITVFDPNPNTEALVHQKFQSEGLDSSFIQFKESIDRAVQGAELIILATPMNAFETVSADIARHAPPTAILTDTGSAKRVAIEQITRGLAKSGLRYVPAHPGNGSQGAGPLTASAGNILGRNSTMFLISAKGESFTPQQDTPEHCVQAFWSSLGVTTTFITAEAHDNFFGQCSHFQHALVFALLNTALELPEIKENFMRAGTALRNLSRVAISKMEEGQPSALTQMWLPIFEQNKGPITTAYERFRKHLDSLVGALKKNTTEELTSMLQSAKEFRDTFADPERRETIEGEIADIETAPSSGTPQEGELSHLFNKKALPLIATNLLLPIAISYAQIMSAHDIDPNFIAEKANPSFRDGTHPSTYSVDYVVKLITTHKEDFLRVVSAFNDQISPLIYAIGNNNPEYIKNAIVNAQNLRNKMPSPRKGDAVRDMYERRCDAA